MTRTGKCDVCRQRKVKCDEKKPKCGACQKRDRSCSYTYGKASAFVLEDPRGFSGHGKAKVAPVVVPLITSQTSPEFVSSSSSSQEDGEVEVLGQTSTSQSKNRSSKRKSVIRRVQQSRASSTSSSSTITRQSPKDLALIRPCSPETTLAARFIHMIGPQALDDNPFSIHGSWLQSIPSRLGCSEAFDCAVEYAVDSFLLFTDKSWSTHKTASLSRGRALKALRFALNDTNNAGMDVLLAIKMHFHGEMFFGKDNWLYYTLHAVNLSNLLKGGSFDLLDDEDYWSVIDTSYMDDVGEAAFAGRLCKYDTPFYVAITAPGFPLFATANLSQYRRVSMAVMHVCIHIPRLICLVRMARNDPSAIDSLAAAVSLTEYLWTASSSDIVDEYIKENTTSIPLPPSVEIQDIIVDSLHFRSIQSLIMITRYWTFLSYLCSLTETLYLYFPTQCAASLLPAVEKVYECDMVSAGLTAKSIPYVLSIFPNLPLVPLRVLSPIQVSIGTWSRTIARLRRTQALFDAGTPEYADVATEIAHFKRMQDWLVTRSNMVHEMWGADVAVIETFEIALEVMNGGPIPGWLPTWLESWQTGEISFSQFQKMIWDEVQRKQGKGGKGWWLTPEEYEKMAVDAEAQFPKMGRVDTSLRNDMATMLALPAVEEVDDEGKAL